MQADSTLTVAKQRHGEWEGQFKFWFDKDSMQYTPDFNNRPIPYMADFNDEARSI